MIAPALYALALVTALAGGPPTRVYDLPNYPVAINNAGVVLLDTGTGTIVFQNNRAYPLADGTVRLRAINDLGELAGRVAGRATLFKPAPGFHINHTYTLVDIGGGAGGPILEYPRALNNRPQVLGTDLSSDAILWTRATGPRLAWSGFPVSLNQRGDACGLADERQFPQYLGYVLFADGTASILGTHTTAPRSINDLREVVGDYVVSENPTVRHGFHWAAGAYRDLAPLPGHSGSIAVAINNRGTVVGASYPPSGVMERAVRWDATGIVDYSAEVSMPGLHLTNVFGVNDHEQVICDGLLNGMGRYMYLVTPEAVPRAVYRLYNRRTFEHLLTTDLNEYNFLGSHGWLQEGRAFAALDSPGPYGDEFPIALYRLYNSASLQHLYTTEPYEAIYLRDLGTWTYEGISGFVFLTPVPGSRALHRLMLPRPPLHHWTADANEALELGRRGWIDEGIVGYVLDQSAAPLTEERLPAEWSGQPAMDGTDIPLTLGGVAVAASEP